MRSRSNRTRIAFFRKALAYLSALLCFGLLCPRAAGQAEVSGWGNLRGIRVGGQLVPFTTAVGVFNTTFSQATLSQREGPTHTTQYLRNGKAVTVGASLQYGEGGSRGAGGRGGRGGAGVAAGTGVTSRSLAARGTGGRGGNGRRGGSGSGFNYTITYTDSAPGACAVDLRLTSPQAQKIGGLYYFLVLPAEEFANGTARLITGAPEHLETPLNSPDEQGRYLTASATGIRITGKKHQAVELRFPQAREVVVQQARSRKKTENGKTKKADQGNAEKADNEIPNIRVYFPLAVGSTTAGQTVQSSFTLQAACEVDTAPATVSIEPAKPGQLFIGMGGNYRIQSSRDAPVIQYVLDHMRVAYGRVAMPWNRWQPEENAAPPLLAAAAQPATLAVGQSSGRPNTPASGGFGGGMMNSVAPAMEIAQTLAQKKIPMIISCWFPPSWAVLNTEDSGGQRGGGSSRGQRLDPAKWDQICKSIGAYLIYLHDRYGAEPEYFSFNESNIGINVKQTPEDHAEAIRKLGAYFQSVGLKTRMLLGDTGDAKPVDFIEAAMNDPEAVKYIGAISFHSWRGATDEQYQKWTAAAVRLGVPLFDGEGGNDAQASVYRAIFREPWYALDEAAEYVRIMRICQPKSILEWQLTDDYSVLAAEPGGALQPTQRFFNLKQFNLAPAGSAWIPAHSDSGLVLPAACLEPLTGACTIHLVNNGASRQVTLTGLPVSVAHMNVFITDAGSGMAKLESLKIVDGQVRFTLQGQALTTLSNAPVM